MRKPRFIRVQTRVVNSTARVSGVTTESQFKSAEIKFLVPVPSSFSALPLPRSRSPAPAYHEFYRTVRNKKVNIESNGMITGTRCFRVAYSVKGNVIAAITVLSIRFCGLLLFGSLAA